MSAPAPELLALRDISLFAAVGQDCFEKLIGSTRLETLRPGDTLFRQGDPVHSVFIVVEGWVKLVRLTPGGEEIVIRLFNRGHSFAETLALSPRPHSTSAEAATRCVVARIPATVASRIAHECPDLAFAIVQAGDMSIYALMDEIESLKAQSADERVARFILSLCSHRDGPCTVHLPFGKRLIADYLGVKQETLSRCFAKLRGIGIDIGRNEIHVTNVPRLEAALMEDAIP